MTKALKYWHFHWLTFSIPFIITRSLFPLTYNHVWLMNICHLFQQIKKPPSWLLITEAKEFIVFRPLNNRPSVTIWYRYKSFPFHNPLFWFRVYLNLFDAFFLYGFYISRYCFSPTPIDESALLMEKTGFFSK